MIQYFPSKCHWSIFKFIIEKDRSWKLFQRPASQEVIVCIRWAESSWGREVIKTKQLCAIDAYQIKTTVFILYLISYTFILYNKHQHITTLNPLTGEVTHTDDLFTLQCSSGSWVDITYTVLLRYHPPKNWRRTRAGSDGLTVPAHVTAQGSQPCWVTVQCFCRTTCELKLHINSASYSSLVTRLSLQSQ